MYFNYNKIKTNKNKLNCRENFIYINLSLIKTEDFPLLNHINIQLKNTKFINSKSKGPNQWEK